MVGVRLWELGDLDDYGLCLWCGLRALEDRRAGHEDDEIVQDEPRLQSTSDSHGRPVCQ